MLLPHNNSKMVCPMPKGESIWNHGDFQCSVPWWESIFSSTAGSCFRKGVVLVASNFHTKDRDLFDLFNGIGKWTCFGFMIPTFWRAHIEIKWKVSKSTKGVPLWTSAYFLRVESHSTKGVSLLLFPLLVFETRSRRQLHSTPLGVRTTETTGDGEMGHTTNTLLCIVNFHEGVLFQGLLDFLGETCSRNTSDSRLVCQNSARSNDLKVCQLVTWESSWWWIVFEKHLLS